MQRLHSVFAIAFLLAFGTAACAEESEPEQAGEQTFIEEGREFRRITPAQPTSAAPGEVEVLEFFWYGCPHCYQAEKYIQAWRENAPGNVIFRRVPATLSRGWVTMAQAYYAAEQLDVLDTMHTALFAAFHEDGRMLASEDQLAAYFKEKAGIDEGRFREAFNSLTVASQVKRADMLSRRYRVAGVPSMAINGKYVTDPQMARSYEAMVDTVDTLARWELKAQSEAAKD